MLVRIDKTINRIDRMIEESGMDWQLNENDIRFLISNSRTCLVFWGYFHLQGLLRINNLAASLGYSYPPQDKKMDVLLYVNNHEYTRKNSVVFDDVAMELDRLGCRYYLRNGKCKLDSVSELKIFINESRLPVR